MPPTRSVIISGHTQQAVDATRDEIDRVLHTEARG
jgi:hypothetical protein